MVSMSMGSLYDCLYPVDEFQIYANAEKSTNSDMGVVAELPGGERTGVVAVLVDRLILDVRLRSRVVEMVEYLETDLLSFPSLLTSMSRAISSNVLFLVFGTLK